MAVDEVWEEGLGVGGFRQGSGRMLEDQLEHEAV